MEIFSNTLDYGFSGLHFTRPNSMPVSPDVKTILLGNERSGSSLSQISDAVADFISKNGKSAVLIDRIDYLFHMFGFEDTLRFLYRINEKITVNDSLLLVYLNPGILDPKKLAILEQEMPRLPEFRETYKELNHDLNEIIDFINSKKTMNKDVSFKDITRNFKIPKSTTRKRVNRLKELELVDVRKKGRLKLVVLK